MHKGFKEWLCLLLFLAGTKVSAQSTLVVPVTGIQKPRGQILYSLYRNADGFPDQPTKAFRMGSIPVKGSICTLKFESLPAGTYALAVIHDENGNGRLDKNKIGIPTESVGFSNNVMGAFGPPKFQRAQFTVPTNKNELTAIRLRMGP